MWEHVSGIARFAFAAFLIIGLLAIRAAIKMFFKNREQDTNPSHGHMKQVYSGVLSHTEVINEEYVRYHFNGFTVDTFIATRQTGHPKLPFNYNPEIEKFATMTNVPVTLSIATIYPHLNIVLGIDYDQQHFTESEQPMDVEDKKKLLQSGRNSAGCFVYVASFFFILFNVVSKFNFNTFLLTLAFLVTPSIFVIRYLYRTSSKNVQAAGYKSVIKTIITEKIHLRIKSSDNDSHYNYLRLGNGFLTEITGGKSYKSKCNPGDEIVMEYEVDKKGGRGVLLEIRNA
jgi:hypothetical protein